MASYRSSEWLVSPQISAQDKKESAKSRNHNLCLEYIKKQNLKVLELLTNGEGFLQYQQFNNKCILPNYLNSNILDMICLVFSKYPHHQKNFRSVKNGSLTSKVTQEVGFFFFFCLKKHHLFLHFLSMVFYSRGSNSEEKEKCPAICSECILQQQKG